MYRTKINPEIAAVNIINLDYGIRNSTEVIVGVLIEAESLDELISIFGVKYIQEVLTVEDEEENTEELNIFK